MDDNSARSKLDRSWTDLSKLLSSDYGNPIINRTVPCEGGWLGAAQSTDEYWGKLALSPPPCLCHAYAHRAPYSFLNKE